MTNKIKTAFTLIELLVVIAIIGILSGLIIVGMSSSVNSARVAKAQIFSASLKDSLLANIISEWKFDSISGTLNSSLANGTVVADTWGNSNGTSIGGTTGPILRGGNNCIYGQCIQFDGVDDYVSNSANWDNIFSNGITIGAWVKIPNYNSYQRMVTLEDNANTTFDVWLQVMSTTGIIQFGSGGSGKYKNGSTAIIVNNWYYIVGTTDYTESGTKIYVNGMNDGGSIGTTPTYLADKGVLDIGKLMSSGVGFFLQDLWMILEFIVLQSPHLK